MKAIFCDDDLYFMDMIVNAAEKVFSELGVELETTEYVNSEQLLYDLSETQADADVVFLDIDMPGISGFDIAEKIKEIETDVNLIFVSGIDDLVYESFRYAPFWFLRKSDIGMMHEVAAKLIQYRGSLKRKYRIECRGEVSYISVNDIAYIESRRHYITVHMIDKDIITFRGKISDAEKQLEKDQFIRCHQSYLVNCRYIKKIIKDTIVMSSDVEIPVSRGRSKPAKMQYLDYLHSL